MAVCDSTESGSENRMTVPHHQRLELSISAASPVTLLRTGHAYGSLDQGGTHAHVGIQQYTKRSAHQSLRR